MMAKPPAILSTNKPECMIYTLQGPLPLVRKYQELALDVGDWVEAPNPS